MTKRPLFWIAIAVAGTFIAIVFYAWSIGKDLRAARSGLASEQRRTAGLRIDLKATCKDQLRTVRAVDILLNDPARPAVDSDLKRKLQLATSLRWSVDCQDEFELMQQFLYGTPQQRQQQLDALADEAEQRQLQFENKRFWILVDGKKIWVDPDPVAPDAR